MRFRRTWATRLRLLWVAFASAAAWGAILVPLHGEFDFGVPLVEPTVRLTIAQRLWPVLAFAALALVAGLLTLAGRRWARFHRASDRATLVAVVAGLVIAYAVFYAAAKAAF
jgi:hypothetical protein